jgi:hypothetical protein
MEMLKNYSTQVTEKFRALAGSASDALSGDPEKDYYNDGDTPDDTHICRVLRKRYKDKRLPGWLPRDPKAPHIAPVQVVLSPNVGDSYGQFDKQHGDNKSGPDFSKLFGDTPKSTQEATQSPGQVRGKIGKTASNNPYMKQQEKQQQEPINQRQLPSQMKGSQQVKDLLRKAKWRPESPNQLSQPIAQGRYDSYGSSNNAASSYESSLEQRDDLYRGGGKRGADQPVMGANSPWANNDNEFGGGGYNPAYDTGSQGGGYRIQQGLPTNPSSGRRGPGLPNGPRRGYI